MQIFYSALPAAVQAAFYARVRQGALPRGTGDRDRPRAGELSHRTRDFGQARP